MILVDLTDAVADALDQPFTTLSMEKVDRNLYFFTQAHARGQDENVMTYLAANPKVLGILKSKRKGAHLSPLELIPVLTVANPS